MREKWKHVGWLTKQVVKLMREQFEGVTLSWYACLCCWSYREARGVAGGGCLGEIVFALTHRDKLLG